MAWATDGRLVLNERKFNLVLAIKKRKPGLNLFVILFIENPQFKEILSKKSISRPWKLLWMTIYKPNKEKMKNYIKLSFIWDQSGICSSNGLEMRAF